MFLDSADDPRKSETSRHVADSPHNEHTLSHLFVNVINISSNTKCSNKRLNILYRKQCRV